MNLFKAETSVIYSVILNLPFHESSEERSETFGKTFLSLYRQRWKEDKSEIKSN